MRIVCWQTILMKYHTLFFFPKFEKMSQNLSSAAVVIGALKKASTYEYPKMRTYSGIHSHIDTCCSEMGTLPGHGESQLL